MAGDSMFILNTHPDYQQALDEADRQTFGAAAAAEAEQYARARAGYLPTRLVDLRGLAHLHGVGAIQIKDESTRFGLGSFKALGGAYAVIRHVLDEAGRQLGHEVGMADIASEAVRGVAKHLVVACATDGNHGRSVAQGAQLMGARAVIFVHAGVSEARIAAIACLGAEIVRVPGSYDDSVAQATAVSQDRGWAIVSDTSWPGYERIPSLVMQGYTTLLLEAFREMSLPPTHVFVQAGVGGIAAATFAYMDLFLGRDRPRFIVVDPSRAPCLYQSARQGKRVRIAEGEPTIMAMLECYEPSMVAWRILTRTADAFMTVDEADAVDAMRTLAAPVDDDPSVVAGESGGVGLAAFLKAARDESIRRSLALGPESRIFVINTEGATDPAQYERLVGRSPDQVLAGA